MGIIFKRVETKPESTLLEVEGTRGLFNKESRSLGTLSLYSDLRILNGYPRSSIGKSMEFKSRKFSGETHLKPTRKKELTREQKQVFKKYAAKGSRKQVHDELNLAFEAAFGKKPGLVTRWKTRWFLHRASKRFELAEFKAK